MADQSNTPPLPAFEAGLAWLREPGVEQALSALLRLAAQACGMSMASMAWRDGQSLRVTHAHGLSIEDAASVGCHHASASRTHAPMAMTQEPSFCLRFAVGMGIPNSQGHSLGCLVVHGGEPREMTPAQMQALCDLAALAANVWLCARRSEALVRLTITDPLTGLSNRNHFDQALMAELAHAMRLGEPFTLLRMDLDGFKDVQEGFGHAAGEQVLCEVARRMSLQLRQGDVLARLDADQFGIVMRHGAKDSAQMLAKRIVKAVSAPIVLSSGDEIGVGISIGMAAYSDAILAAPMMLQRAEQALFEAKKQNEKRWKMFVGIR